MYIDPWYNEMHEKYYHLFSTYEGEEKEGGYYKKGQILRGVEVGEGWKWVIEKFLENLNWLRENRRMIPNPEYTGENKGYNLPPFPYIEGPLPDIKIFQIKEKFGELVIYMDKVPDHITDDVEKLIGKAEARAELTCINCGKVTDKLENKSRWIRFQCEECNKEMK